MQLWLTRVLEPKVRLLLVLEGAFPANLQPLKRALELEVVERVEVPNQFKLPKGIRPSTGSPDAQD